GPQPLPLAPESAAGAAPPGRPGRARTGLPGGDVHRPRPGAGAAGGAGARRPRRGRAAPRRGGVMWRLVALRTGGATRAAAGHGEEQDQAGAGQDARRPGGRQVNDEERDAVPGEDHEADPFAGREGALATEALVATLAPSGLPEGGWERLAAAVSARAGAARPAERPTVGPAVTGATLRPAPRRPLAYAALAVAVLALGGVGAWGLVQRAEAARLRDDQRILAYWMSNPGMVLTPLQPADS